MERRCAGWIVIASLAFACAGTPARRAECPSEETVAPAPEGGRNIAPADLAPLAVEPQRLVSMVGDEGVALVRLLNCEREALESQEHTCDDAEGVLAPILPVLQARVRSWLSYEEESGVSCSGEDRVRCVVPPHGECESRFTLVFEEGALVGVIERDDWQSPEDHQRVNDRRVEDFFAIRGRCAAPR